MLGASFLVRSWSLVLGPGARARAGALLFVIASFAAVATVHPQGPVFDAASIRPSAGQTKRGIIVTPTGIVFRAVSPLNCLEEAYGVTPHQISGPAWIRTDRYDIIARTSEPMTPSQMMARLQTLLTDRFKLSLRRTKQDSRVFALVVRKDGPRLTKAPPDESEGRRESAGGMSLRFRSTSMPELAAYLGRQGPIGIPVVDETSLAGRFDFVLTLVRGESSADEGKKTAIEGGVTTYVDALASLGLGLQSRRRPLDVIVIDRAERIQTPN